MSLLTVTRRVYLIAALACATGVGVSAALLYRLSALDASYKAVLAGPMAARRDALAAQVRFKMQVQEWKDILLRGYKADMRAKYTKQFHEQSAAVEALIDTLRTHAADDSAAVRLAGDFSAEHRALDKQYEGALAVF
jgi:methyl-accepting chemotaxis protein